MSQFTCFLDLDGVLADFVAGACKFFGKDIPHSEVKWDLEQQFGLTRSDFWNPLGKDFWANLPPCPEMGEVIRVVEKHFDPNNVYVASHPCLTPGCSAGKAIWVETHLPRYARRIILVPDKSVFAGDRKVLIDDHDHNCEKWSKAGGTSFLLPRPWNAMANIQDPVAHLDDVLSMVQWK